MGSFVLFLNKNIPYFLYLAPGGAYLISNVFEGGLNRGKGLIKFLKF